MPDCEGSLGVEKPAPPIAWERSVYTHEEYINLVLQSGHVMTHDYSSHSTDEDPRMMAFFDSLVQRELEGCSSDDDLSSGEQELYERIIQLSHSDISNGSESESGADGGHSAANNAGDVNLEEDPSAYSPFSIAFASVVAVQTSRSLEEQASGMSLEASLDVSTSNQNEDISDSNANLDTVESGTNGNSSNRRSISDLIAQKRREVKRQATEALRNKKRKRKRPRSSSSESSDGEQNIKSATHSAATTSGHPDNVLSAERQKANLQLKRLQQLRTSILKSDSENSDNEGPSVKATCSKKPSTVTKESDTKTGCIGKEFSGTNTNAIGKELGESSSKDETEHVNSAKASFMKSKESSELGPYLHESDGNQPSTSSQIGVKSFHLHKDYSCDKSSVTNSSNTRESAQCSTSETSSGSHSNFTEFKRFKNRTKASRRQYRQHSSDNGENEDQ